MPPNRVPIVSTGRPKTYAASAAAATAISMPGQEGRSRLSPRMTPIVRAATPTAAGLTVPAASPSATSFSISSPGSLPGSARPNNSLSWLAKMMTAMPDVKPTVTG
jgi:hypothetical protein